MNRSALLMLAAAGLAVAARSTAAQECFWTLRPGAGPQEVSSNAAVFHSALGRVVCVDYDFSGSLKTWVYDGSAWTLHPSAGPPQRFWYEAAYDSARNRLVIYGGFFVVNGPDALDTWEWDGSVWEQRATTGPGRRLGHAMTFDPLRGRTVLYGGSATSAEVWEWDGTAWAAHAAPGPGPRSGNGLAFDPVRGRTVLYGGSASSTQFNDVWEWDGASWSPRPFAGPGPRTGVAMVYDTSRSRLLIAGGGTRPGETWELDNATGQLTFRSAGNGPGTPHPMVFDPIRGRGVVVAGLLGTWEWNGEGTTTGVWITAQPMGGQFSPGAAATLSVAAEGTGPLTYQWRKGGQPLSNGGAISGATSATLRIDPLGIGDTGSYDAVIGNACGSATSQAVPVFVLGGPCYANCDGSSIPPVLNVSDFVCFQNAFAASSTYANCDGSTTPPVLNVMDFVCFQSRYAQGCP